MHLGTEPFLEIERILREAEVAAAGTAAPVAAAEEVMRACRDSGRTVAVLSTSSGTAVETYLGRNGLRSLVGAVVAVPPASAR